MQVKHQTQGQFVVKVLHIYQGVSPLSVGTIEAERADTGNLEQKCRSNPMLGHADDCNGVKYSLGEEQERMAHSHGVWVV